MSRTQYRTRDLYEAAALDAAGMRLVALEPTQREGERMFVFEGIKKSDNVEAIADEYWGGGLVVKARTYADAMRRLKDRLFK